MATVREKYEEHERLMDKYLNHPGYNEDDLFNPVTKGVNRHLAHMEKLEQLAQTKGWDSWIL